MAFWGEKGRRDGGQNDYNGYNNERSRRKQGGRGYEEDEYYRTAEGSLEDEEDYREYVREREQQDRRRESSYAGTGNRQRTGQTGRARDGRSAQEQADGSRGGRRSAGEYGRSQGGYADSQYRNSSRSSGRYADERYGDDSRHRDDGRSSGRYADNQYRDDGRSSGRYADERYGDDSRHRDDGRSSGRYADERYGDDSRYRNDGRSPGGYADARYRDDGRYREGFQTEDVPRSRGKRRKKRGILGRIVLCLFLVFVIVAAVAGGFFYFRMRPVLSVQRMSSSGLEEKLMPDIASKVKNDELMEGYTNIALFGVDSRSGDLLDGDNRSDTIMICSINDKTGEVRLVSVYRDTLLDIGNDVYTKANSAYARGGPERAISMLNRNLDLNILDFVTVGFEGLANTIDALGGIEVEIDEEEREYINMYVHDMHKELGTEDTPVERSGLVTLNGIQATAYSRIRYTAGDDFRRAERQRTVLKKTLEKAKGADPVTLVNLANELADNLATSLSSTEIASLIMKASRVELAGTEGLPREEYRSFGSSVEDGEFVLPLTLGDNVRWLHEFLFNEEDYSLSEEAASIDEYIQNNYGPSY